MKRMYDEKELQELIKKSATKLYKHNIELDDGSNLIINSTKSTGYTSLDALALDFGNIAFISGTLSSANYENGVFFGIIKRDNGHRLYYYDSSEETIMHIDTQRIVQDTITPL